MDKIRPMAKVYRLRDMKREVKGLRDKKACKNLLEMAMILLNSGDHHQTTIMFGRLELSFKLIQNPFNDHDSLVETELKLGSSSATVPPSSPGYQVACLHLLNPSICCTSCSR